MVNLLFNNLVLELLGTFFCQALVHTRGSEFWYLGRLYSETVTPLCPVVGSRSRQEGFGFIFHIMLAHLENDLININKSYKLTKI